MGGETAMLSGRAVTQGAAPRGARWRGRGGLFLGALAAGAVVALVGFRPGVKNDGVAPKPAYALGQLRPASWPANAITAGYLGHATLLIDYLGVHIITDPTF